MNKTITAIILLFVAIVAVATYSLLENRKLAARTEELSLALGDLRSENVRLREQLESLESGIDDMQVAAEVSRSSCDTRFPAGLYRLSTTTSYGPTSGSEYDIYHVSVSLSVWGINTGTRVNSFGIPTDFYFDYNGDGRNDTAIAARFVREIPMVGNSIADRMLADSRVHQNLYSVFSCEWRNAEFTSVDDMNNSVSGTSKMLWDLVQDNSASLFEWISSE